VRLGTVRADSLAEKTDSNHRALSSRISLFRLVLRLEGWKKPVKKGPL